MIKVAAWCQDLNDSTLRFLSQIGVDCADAVPLLARDADGDGRSDGARGLITGLDRPPGIDLHDGWLYVAETSGVGRIRFDAESGTTRGACSTTSG